MDGQARPSPPRQVVDPPERRAAGSAGGARRQQRDRLPHSIYLFHRTNGRAGRRSVCRSHGLAGIPVRRRGGIAPAADHALRVARDRWRLRVLQIMTTGTNPLPKAALNRVVKVLVVDDSAYVRKMVAQMLSRRDRKRTRLNSSHVALSRM